MAVEPIKTGKINALESLETIGVSLVKRGANKRLFALTKSKEGNEMKVAEMLKTVLDEGSVENPQQLKAVAKSADLSDKGMAALEAIVKMRDAFAEEPGLQKALLAIVKEGMPGASDEEDNSTMTQSRKAMDGDKDEEETTSKSKKARKAMGDDEEEETYKEEEKDEEETKKAKKALAKSLSGVAPEVKSHLESIFKAYEDRLERAEERAQKSEMIAKSEQNARVEREWLQKAEKYLTHVPGKKPVEIAKSLKRLADKDPDAANEQFEMLRRSSDAIRKSAMFHDVGTGNTGDGSLSAYDEIQSKVDQMVLKSDGKLSREQATVKVMQLFPDLYSRADEEQQERVRNRR